MNQVTQLVEQQIRTSELHLRHVDDLMERARLVSQSRSVPPDTAARLAQFSDERDRLAQELRDYRVKMSSINPPSVTHAEGLTGVLEAMGLQLEKALTAILETGQR